MVNENLPALSGNALATKEYVPPDVSQPSSTTTLALLVLKGAVPPTCTENCEVETSQLAPPFVPVVSSVSQPLRLLLVLTSAVAKLTAEFVATRNWPLESV